MTATIEDVADLVGSLAWPLVALIVALALRPALRAALERGTLQKLGIGPLSLEFAAAERYEPTSQVAPLIDATAGPPVLSTLQGIVAELEGPTVDYVVIDLGGGQRWLTSRLYVFGQLVRRMRGVRAFVFVRSVNPECVFLATADAESTLWLLAERYPFLEAAFAAAYGEWWSHTDVEGPSPDSSGDQPISSSTGRLPGEATEEIALGFLARLQEGAAVDDREWVKLARDDMEVWERARWLSADSVERLLGGVLNTSRVDRSTHAGDENLARAVATARGEFVAIVDADGRFERLIDRMKIVELAAQRCISGR